MHDAGVYMTNWNGRRKGVFICLEQTNELHRFESSLLCERWRRVSRCDAIVSMPDLRAVDMWLNLSGSMFSHELLYWDWYRALIVGDKWIESDDTQTLSSCRLQQFILSKSASLLDVLLDSDDEAQDGEKDCGCGYSGEWCAVAEVIGAVTAFTFDSTDVIIQAVICLSDCVSWDALSYH